MLKDWLNRAIAQSGISQAALARALSDALGRSFDRAAVNKMAKGTRAIAADELLVIARVTNAQPPDLEEPTAHARQAQLVGYVAAGSAAVLYAESQGPFDTVDAPEGSTENTVAVEVRGTSLGPVLDQWLVFYDRVEDPPNENLAGKLCVVGLPDGRILVKQLRKARVHARELLRLCRTAGSGAQEKCCDCRYVPIAIRSDLRYILSISPPLTENAMQTDLPDNLTLGQIKAIAAMFGGAQASATTRVEGDLRPVIVRARDAGVHYGKLVAYGGRTVWLRNSRRLWSWRAKEGIALSGVAVNGIDASKSKVDALASNIVITDACEIIDATAQAAASIEAA